MSAEDTDDTPPPGAPVARMRGFRLDDEGQWVAELDCGHTQHVRHRPPWELRPWVTTEEGRRGRIGAELPCSACRMPRLPEGLVEYKRTAEFDAATLPVGLTRDHSLKADVWGEIVVTEARVHYVLEDDGGFVVVLRPGLNGTIAPERRHRVELKAGARFYVRFLRRA